MSDDQKEDRTAEIEKLGIDMQREQHNVEVLTEQNKELKDKVTQLTAMCYTLARRLRNEAFNDNMVSVQRQQMAELAMQSLVMTHEVWELVHKSEEQQQQNNI